jgi:hypothetical protein
VVQAAGVDEGGNEFHGLARVTGGAKLSLRVMAYCMTEPS